MRVYKAAFQTSLFILLAAAAVIAVPARRAAAQSTQDSYIYEDESFLDRMQDVQKTAANPFADVPPDHWAYKAVKRLADAGLLNGYNGQLFRGDQVVTRYEMAALVAKLLDGYLEWYHSGGRVTKEDYTTVNSPTGRPYPPTGAPLRAIAPPDAVIAPTRRTSVDLPSLGSMALDRTSPKFMGEPKQDGGGTIGTLTPEMQQQVKDIAATSAKQEVDLRLKDLEVLQKLVNEFKTELKDYKKGVDKQLKENKTINLQNTKAINDLRDEDARFKITGNNRFFWDTEGPITGDDCLVKDPTDVRCNMRTADLANQLTLNFKSKPEKDVDLSLGGALSAYTELGGNRNKRGDMTKAPGDDSTGTAPYDYYKQQAAAAYNGYLEGTNTALSLSNIYVNYNNPDDPQKPRNFRLRSLYLGDYSLLFSPFTVMGKQLHGFTAAFGLNKYSLTLFGARERLHQHEPSILPDNSNTNWKFNTMYFNGDQFDRYKYGASLETSLFGNPLTRLNLTRMFMYDDKDTNYTGCKTGKWMDLTFAYDEFTYKTPNTDIGSTDLFCLPAVKNSVSSAFLMYPLFKDVSFMGEYAHSTYYKPYYKVQGPFTDFGPNDFSVNAKYSTWWESKERAEQDDGFLVLFTYNKGPLTLFPLVYLHLGPNFVTDMDLSAFGGNFDITSVLSILPISIQSLDGKVAGLKYEIQGKESLNTIYAELQENHPMYFDIGALETGLSNSDSKGSATTLLGQMMTKLNASRTSKLKAKIWNTTYKHFLSDRISISGAYTKIGLLLPESCIDGNLPYIVDDFGISIDKGVGDGITDCAKEGDDTLLGIKFWMTTQKYELDWDTSKRTQMRTAFTIKDQRLIFKYRPQDFTGGMTNTELYVDGLVSKGKNYELSEEIRYKLTNSTRLRFSYSYVYDRYGDYGDPNNVGSGVYNTTDSNGWKYPVIDYQKFLFMVETNF